MNWFAELPTVWKAATALGGALAIGFVAETVLHTDAEAAELWQQHLQYETCRTVAQMQAEIRGLTERLQFDATLTQQQRAWLQQQIANIQAEIRRIDPGGVC